MATATNPTRLAMLARVERGELDHSAAARALGLTPGVWGLWRARHAKAAGDGKLDAHRVHPPGKATPRASSPTGSLDGVVAQLEGLRRFGEELRERVSAMVELVEGRFPG